MQNHFRKWMTGARASVAALGVIAVTASAYGQLGGVLRGARDAVGGAGRTVDRTIDNTEWQVDRTYDRVDRRMDRQLDNRFDGARGPVRGAIGDTVRGAGRIVGDTARVATGRPPLGLRFDAARRGDLIVSDIDANSIAYRAGVRSGDQIVSLGGRRFDDIRAANAFIDDFRDDTMDIVVLRDGRRVNLSADFDVAVNARAGFPGDRPALGVWFDTSAGDLTILRVAEGSPAFNAGIRPGDRILALDGRRVNQHRDVTRYLADLQPGEQVDILVWRDGRQLQLDATLAMAADFDRGVRRDAYVERRTYDRGYDFEGPSLGVVFDDYDRDSLIVTRIESGSPAFRAGLRRGDRIYSIDGRRINGYRELTSTLQRLDTDSDVSIGVIRNGRRVDVDARLASRQDVFDDRRDERREARRDDRYDDRRERVAERFDDRQGRMDDRFDERERRMTDRFEDRADRMDDRRERVTDRITEGRDEFRDNIDRRAEDARDRFDRTREARRTEIDRARDRARSTRDEAEEEMDDIRSRGREALDDARDQAREATSDARSRARDARDSARDRAEDAYDNRRQPPREPQDEGTSSRDRDENTESYDRDSDRSNSDQQDSSDY